MTRPVSSLIGRLRALRRSRFGRDESGTTAIEFAHTGRAILRHYRGDPGDVGGHAGQPGARQCASTTPAVSSAPARHRAQNLTKPRFKPEYLRPALRRCSAIATACVSGVEPITDFASAAAATSPVEADCPRRTATGRCRKNSIAGAGSNIVLVQAYYKWPIIFSFGGFGLANQADNTRLIATVRVFRNEPF